MKTLSDTFETYLMTLVHPFKLHQQFRSKIPMNSTDNHLFEPLTMAEGLGISWIFAIIRGLFKLIILNVFLSTFMSLQSEEFHILQELVQSSGFATYYFLLFSAALDIIFFPIGALILTELWSWVIRTYAKFLNPSLPAEQIADEISVHALGSNLFNIIPFIGDFIQTILYFYLLYAGLRSNLGASRSLSAVILLTPTLIGFMLISLFGLIFFYLVS
jgi:hypothetical protein